ncbi:MAG: acetate--CoA ligase family protein [Alphaproteobacteria bacterium]
MIELLVHAGLPETDDVGVLVYSGGVRGLSLDAADRHGVPLPDFSPETAAKFKEILGDDLRVTNPLDAAGFMNQKLESIVEMVTAIQNDPKIGTILFQEDLPPSEGINDANKRRTKRVLDTMQGFQENFLDKGGKPIGLISPASSDLTTFGREARKQFPQIPVLSEPNRAFKALRTAFTYRDRIHEAQQIQPGEAGKPSEVIETALSNASSIEPFALSEPVSKNLISSYGISLPREGFAKTPEEAAKIGDEIGYPVVVKGVAAEMTHKSDAGAVVLGLHDGAAVERACNDISGNVASYDSSIELEGWLVAQSVSGGLELVIGIQRDPEMGPVVMFGLGGVWLELIKDVSFCSPGFGRARADRMINETRAGRLIDGYRGDGPYDREAVIDALVAVGQMAMDNSDTIESLDINPFVALSPGAGAYALDALAVLSR